VLQQTFDRDGSCSYADSSFRLEIGDHADDILGDQSADCSAEIDGVQDLAVWHQQEIRRLITGQQHYSGRTVAQMVVAALGS
jgi:hypothetical protein